ncbi:MAG: hypothetical protein QM681_13760 [Novosphingobium sp.]
MHDAGRNAPSRGLPQGLPPEWREIALYTRGTIGITGGRTGE